MPFLPQNFDCNISFFGLIMFELYSSKKTGVSWELTFANGTFENRTFVDQILRTEFSTNEFFRFLKFKIQKN